MGRGGWASRRVGSGRARQRERHRVRARVGARLRDRRPGRDAAGAHDPVRHVGRRGVGPHRLDGVGRGARGHAARARRGVHQRGRHVLGPRFQWCRFAVAQAADPRRGARRAGSHRPGERVRRLAAPPQGRHHGVDARQPGRRIGFRRVLSPHRDSVGRHRLRRSRRHLPLDVRFVRLDDEVRRPQVRGAQGGRAAGERPARPPRQHRDPATRLCRLRDRDERARVAARLRAGEETVDGEHAGTEGRPRPVHGRRAGLQCGAGGRRGRRLFPRDPRQPGADAGGAPPHAPRRPRQPAVVSQPPVRIRRRQRVRDDGVSDGERGDPLRGLGHTLCRRGRHRGRADPHLVLQLQPRQVSRDRDVVTGDRHGPGDRSGAGGGRACDREPARPARARSQPHGLARPRDRRVRFRDVLPADGRTRDGAGLEAGHRDPRGGHGRDHPDRSADARRRSVSDEPSAIERLERRVATLEDAVRRLIALQTGTNPLQLPVRPRPRREPVVDVDATTLASPPAPVRPTRDLEEWFGQRGLLVVGVLALLAAGAFFLKYAFDRHWIPPLVRSLLAIVVGVVVAAWGDWRVRKGMRRYGAALIGAGAGLVYLGVWAAAGPYALVDRRAGVLLLAASTVAVTLLALHHEIESLAIWALAGAYLAPALLPPPVANQQAFLGYLEVVGIGTGILAYTQTWRRTFSLALFGYLLLARSACRQ